MTTDLTTSIKAATGEDLGLMADHELAQWQAGWKPDSAQGILAAREWERRQAVRVLQEQFALDRKLMDANVRAMWVAAILGILGTLAGAALGAYMSMWFTHHPL